jgi:hypothetical protein
MAKRVGSAFRNAPSTAHGAHTNGVREATMGGVEDRAKKNPRERTFGVVAFRNVQLPVVGCFDFRDW